MLPRISIVTVNLNNDRFLEEAMCSVLDQGYPNLEYIVIDGGSTDGSVEIIKKYASRLAYWTSEKDEGYGFALQKGFAKATGEIMAWLNSDDAYYPGSLFTVAEIFKANPQVKWFTGFPSWLNESGYRLGEMPNPNFSYWKKRYHLYLKYSRWSRTRFLGGDFQSIQQESTFWRRELWVKAGSRVNTDYKLAIDTELWCRFFLHEQLFTAPYILAGFRWGSQGQLTKIKRDEYINECEVALQEERSKLKFSQITCLKFRYYLAQFLKPFYYFNLPFGSLYEKVLKIPKLLE